MSKSQHFDAYKYKMAGPEREMNTYGLPTATISIAPTLDLTGGNYTITKMSGKLYKLTKTGRYGETYTTYIPEDEVFSGAVTINRLTGKFTSSKYPFLKDYTYDKSDGEITGVYYKLTIPKDELGLHGGKVISSFVRYYPKSVIENNTVNFPGVYEHLPSELKGGARRRKHRGTKKARKHRRRTSRR